MLAGKIATLLIIATVLSLVGALIVAARYRVAMKRLMKIPLATPTVAGAAAGAMPSGLPSAMLNPPATLRLDDNTRAYRQLIVAFLGITIAMSLTRTLIMQLTGNGAITVQAIASLGAAYCWPVVPVIAVLGRWRRRRLLGALLLWFIAAVALLSWRATAAGSFAQVFKWMLLDIGLPLVVVTSLCLGGATRAVGPWLAPLFILLCTSSQAGVDLLMRLIGEQSPSITWLVTYFSPVTGIALFALLPWLVAWWPVRSVGRWLARAYTERRISELFYLFTAVWVIALTGPVLGAIANQNWAALVYFLALLWIPAGAWWMQKTFSGRQGSKRPPTLLVLRVFQQDANVQDLFDRVIERWRMSGNTVLIAGTDLADRTIDAEDIFTFLDGRLGERFIHQPDDIARRLNSFEWQADVEGRFRVNECYCHDSTWKLALAELLRISDVILMDLRNFQSSNEGCLHELRELAALPGHARVVVLINNNTHLDSARTATANSPADRFIWLKQEGDKPPATEDVLSALLGEQHHAPQTAGSVR